MLKVILKKILSFLLFLLLICLLIGVYVLLQIAYIDNTTPGVSSTYPRVESVWDTYENPLEINFNVPVDKSKLNPTITPNIDGEWVWDDWMIFDNLTMKGRFYPTDFTSSSNRFVVYIAGVARYGVDESHELGFVFDSPKVPFISGVTPTNKSRLERLEEVNIILNKPLEKHQFLSLNITPKIDFDYLVQDNTINILITSPVSKGAEYSIDVIITEEDGEDQESHQVGAIKYFIENEVGFRGVMPVGDRVIPNSKIKFRFFEDMDVTSVEQNLQITPELDFQIVWDHPRQFELVYSGELNRDTEYRFSISKGTAKLDGRLSEVDLTHTFKTLGKLNVFSISPSNGSSRVSEWNPIEFVLDQAVVPQSFEANFFTTPAVPGRFEWIDEAHVKFFPTAPFPYSTLVTVGIRAGVETLWGLPNVTDITFYFTTRSNQVVLNLPTCSPYSPEYCQPQYPVSFSCNIYALKMALSWKGISMSAPAIIGEMGYNDSFVNGNWTGNPYTQYVGNADGSWGYGVYWDPTQRILSNRGISSQIMTGWNTVGLAQTIESGFPVVIWRYNGTSSAGTYFWTASDGTQVKAIRGQHGGVVTGYRGTSDAPTHFLLNDPWFGSIWMDVNTFDYYWSFLDRVGLIVY